MLLSSNQKPRVYLGWLLILALAFHGLIPVGYMPDVTHAQGKSLGMTICDGMDHSMTMGSHAENKQLKPHENSNGHKSQNRFPCPFSINAVFANTAVALSSAVPVFLFLTLLLPAGFLLAERRRFGQGAARAPPQFS